MSAAPQRESWSSKSGFILAAVGSAVGLGNMWRFSYLTAEYGGAAFVLLYLLLTAFVGIPVLLAELCVGRGARRSPIGALAHFGGPAWKLLGLLFVTAGALILAYYGVIAGWTVRYAWETLVSGLPAAPGAHFGEVSQGTDAALWHVLFMATTMFVVAGGVRGGIERASLLMMPLLVALVVGIALYAGSLEGAGEGYAYYLSTDFAAIASFDVFKAAASQAFFSLSLGMGAILTYASYLSRDARLPGQAVTIAVADFGMAFVAGLMVFPLLFALGLSGQIIGTAGTENDVGTVGALFITLPQAFQAMEGVGRLLGFLFFLALAVGALTSAVSLLEVGVSSAIDSLGLSRRRAALWLGIGITLLGLGPAYDISILGLMDHLAGNVFLVVGGLALSLFVGWQLRDAEGEVMGADPRRPRWLGLWRLALRVPVPCLLAVVAGFAFLDFWKALVGG
jgi:NSS family neurotransmitter:Na+ symporter